MALRQTSGHTCAICGITLGHRGASRRFPRFFCCPHCGGYALVAPEPEPSYPDRYFAVPGRPGLIGRLAQPFLDYLLYLRVRKTLSLLGKDGAARVLDYGAGNGKFVAALRRRGIDAMGYDPSPAASSLAARDGIPVSSTIPAGPFSVVTLWHSLEHSDEPAETLRLLLPRLADGAKLLIAIPNAASWEAALAGERWFHYDYPYHRVHFTPRSITLLLESAGFRILAIDFFTPEYTVSGLAQTFLNFFLPANALYASVSHRRQNYLRSTAILLAISSLMLLLIAAPILIVVYLLQLLFRKSGAMVVIAQK